MTDRLTRYHRAAVWTAELLLLLLALALSVATDAVVWAAPRVGRLAGRAYRLARHHWPTVCRVADAARVAVVRFVWTQAGYAPAPVVAAPVVAAPVVARALPPLLPALTRRQLLSVARAVRLPRYSRLATDDLRAALAAL